MDKKEGWMDEKEAEIVERRGYKKAKKDEGNEKCNGEGVGTEGECKGAEEIWIRKERGLMKGKKKGIKSKKR